MSAKYECPDCGATRTNAFDFHCEHARCPMMGAPIAASIVRDVAELPDRTSPDGVSQLILASKGRLMLVTDDELFDIVCDALKGHFPPGKAAQTSDRAVADAERRVIVAAHDLLCWTFQHEIYVDPPDYSRNVKDLNTGAWELMNSAQQELYAALMDLNEVGAVEVFPARTRYLHTLAEAAESALDHDTCDQKRAYGFDAPADAEMTITAGTVRKIERLLAAVTAATKATA